MENQYQSSSTREWIIEVAKIRLSLYFACACIGVLACLDGYMNIALEQTEEYVNGQLKNKYGDAFIRGNNGILCRYITLIHSSVQFYTSVSRDDITDE